MATFFTSAGLFPSADHRWSSSKLAALTACTNRQHWSSTLVVIATTLVTSVSRHLRQKPFLRRHSQPCLCVCVCVCVCVVCVLCVCVALVA